MLNSIEKVLTKRYLNNPNNHTAQEWTYGNERRTNYYIALVRDHPDFALNLLPEENVYF